MAAMTIAAVCGQFLLPVFLLCNRVWIGLFTFSTETDERILGHIILLFLLEAVRKGLAKYAAKVMHRHTILGATRPGQAGFNRAKIKLKESIKLRLRHLVGTKQSLGFAVAFNQVNQLGAAPGLAQIAQRLCIDRKERRSCAKFGRHIGDSGAVRQG